MSCSPVPLINDDSVPPDGERANMGDLPEEANNEPSHNSNHGPQEQHPEPDRRRKRSIVNMCTTCACFYRDHPEARAWALDAIGRAVTFIGAAAFLGTALLRLAKESVGCETEPLPGTNQVPPCDKRIYGVFRPSSLLTTYTVVVGVVSATLMPLMGAMLDYTPYRRRLGRVLSTALLVLLFPTIMINEHTWFAVALLQMGVAFVGWAQTMVTYAYLPELTHDMAQLNTYTESFSMISFGSMVVYLIVIVGAASLLGIGGNEQATAQLGQAVGFTVCLLTLCVAWWRLFEPRAAAHELPPDKSVWTAGFIQIYHTIRHIFRHQTVLRWFYISVSFVDASINSLATLMITYMTDTLNFTSTENGLTILLMLVGSVPGAVIAGKTTVWWSSPVRSAMAATALFAAATVTGAIVLTGPGQQLETYALALIWGAATGWKWTNDRVIASALIPSGQEAELMGLYLFSGQILTWLPPLVFTVLNEVGISERVGIGSMAVFLFAGFWALVAMGDFNKAVARVGRMTPVDPRLTASPSAPIAENQSDLGPGNSPTGSDTSRIFDVEEQVKAVQ